MNVKITTPSSNQKILFINQGLTRRKNLVFNLTHQNESLELIILIIGKNHHKIPLKIRVNHKNTSQKADITIKSALFDNARADITGNIIINKNCINTESFLTHHTLLLSENAKTSSLPALEVKENQVKAGHSATTGHLNREEVFYLQSRGISLQNAKKILIEAFFTSELQKITKKSTSKKLKKMIESELK